MPQLTGRHFLDRKMRNHTFNNKHLRHGDRLCPMVVGRQIRTSSTERSETRVVHQAPASTMDYVRHALKAWFPCVPFRWITPEYVDVEYTFRYTDTASYVNVIPNPSPETVKTVLFELVFEEDDPEISDVDWLLGSPPTHEQVQEYKDYIAKLRCSDRFALHMAYSQMHRQ